MIPRKDYKYILSRLKNSMIEVVEVQYNGEKFKVDPKLLFKSDEPLLEKEDAQYELFKYNMNKGKKLSNYKGSKYYKMYIQRAKKENPEFLI